MFEADFSHNYTIEIDENNMSLLHLWLYFVKEKMVKIPCICGIEIANVINYFQGRCFVEVDAVKDVISMIENNTSYRSKKIIEAFMQLYPYQVLLSMRIDCLNYIGKNETYTYLYNNLDSLHKKYVSIVYELVEAGKINPRWKSEFSLYMLVKSYYPNAVYQYHAEWLKNQSLDIYIPDIKIAIEYQGQQHYEAIELFGGTKGLEETQRRDQIKRKKCKTNGVHLIEWNYQTEINDTNFITMFMENNIMIPTKKYAEFIINKSNNVIKTVNEIICQYDLSGKFIAEYNSIANAAKENGIEEYMIRRACTGIRDSAGGYQWRKFNADNKPNQIRPLEKKKSKGEARCVIQFDLNENIMNEYSSVSEAVRMTGINSKSIRDAANEKQKHAGGYKWKYK